MPTLLKQPTRVVDTGVIQVDEHVGHASSDTDLLSMAHVKVNGVGEEAWQTPAFDEFVLVLKGKVVIQHAGGFTTVLGGQSVMLKKGERVKWTFPSPEGAEYVPICVPAFSPANCGREEEAPPSAEQLAADSRRLAEIHARTQHPYLFHLVQKPLWEKCLASGATYFPPTYKQDGFTHATADPNFLIEVGNHFYTDVPGDWLCLRFSVASLESVGIATTFEETAPVGDKPKLERTELFPHVQGGLPPRADVILQTMPVRRDAKGNFLSIEGLHDYAPARAAPAGARRSAGLMLLGACAGAALAAAACRCNRS